MSCPFITVPWATSECYWVPSPTQADKMCAMYLGKTIWIYAWQNDTEQYKHIVMSHFPGFDMEPDLCMQNHQGRTVQKTHSISICFCDSEFINTEKSFSFRKWIQLGGKDGSMAKSTYCSIRGPEFRSQHPLCGSQVPVAPAPRDPKTPFWSL